MVNGNVSPSEAHRGCHSPHDDSRTASTVDSGTSIDKLCGHCSILHRLRRIVYYIGRVLSELKRDIKDNIEDILCNDIFPSLLTSTISSSSPNPQDKVLLTIVTVFAISYIRRRICTNNKSERNCRKSQKCFFNPCFDP